MVDPNRVVASVKKPSVGKHHDFSIFARNFFLTSILLESAKVAFLSIGHLY